MLSAKTRRLLDDQPWDEHLEIMTFYAHSLIKKCVWRGARDGMVPGGKEARDFAHDAISDVYSGTRVWNPEKHPELILFLFDVVKSEVSAAVMSKSNQEVRENADTPEPFGYDDDTVLELLDHVQDDPDLYRYVEAVIAGCKDRTSIAEYLEVKLADVDNLRKRMQRRFDTYWQGKQLL